MKKITQLLACAALVATLAPQLAPAGVLFTNAVRNTAALNIRATLTTAGVSSGETYSPVNGSIRNQYVVGTGGATGKAFIQFDLANAWATYGQSNLTTATLALWNQNGPTRTFWVAGIANGATNRDGTPIETWPAAVPTYTAALNWWTNAPANDYFTPNLMAYTFDYSKCYTGVGFTNLWQVNGLATGDGIGVDVSVPANSQGSVYYSTNAAATARITGFIASHTNNLVTLGISDGPANSNQTIPIGTNGVYGNLNEFGVYTNSQPIAANGIATKDSPTLYLVFNIRVALTGGGLNCPGGPGVDVSMAGTDVGVNYYLTTNGVPTGQFVVGNGTNVSFGLQTTPGSYGAMASNTVTTVVTPVLSYVTVNAPALPSVLVQPTAFVGATNSIGIYTLVATNDGGGYAWYRNGVALTDDGHYYATHTSQLLINPVLASDAATAANGYYCAVSNACGYVTYSTTNALTVQVARNLVWHGAPTNLWDIATSSDWWLNTSGGTATVFNQGDNVLLDNTATSSGLILASTNLAPGAITFNSTGQMGIGGSGSIVGPNTSLIVNNPGSGLSQLVITNANNFGGGTTLNGNYWLTMRNLLSVGTGTITMNGTPGCLLEVVATGSAGAVGVPGLNVVADGTLSFLGNGAYAGYITGPLTGSSGKTLTITAPNATTGSNLRILNTNFTCNANINFSLANSGVTFAPYLSTGSQTYNGVISGNCLYYPRAGGSGNIIFNNQNTYTGGSTLSGGSTGVGVDSVGVDGGVTSGALGTGTLSTDSGTGTQKLFASGGAHTIGNSIVYVSSQCQTLDITGTNQLTFAGTHDLGSGGVTSATNRTVQVDSTAPAIMAGVISDSSSLGCGLVKTGTGSMYLNNANTYTGPTICSAGLLAGTGSVQGPVTVTTNGVIGAGTPASMGTLTINGNLTLAGGGGFFRVDRAGGTPVSGHVAVTGSIVNTGTGTITITNVGAPLQVGDTFLPFNGASVSGGSALIVTGAGVTWTNKLATGGGIQVLSTTAAYSTNITATISGSTLTVSWPSTHLGWILQNQTNSLSVGLNTNWADVAGSSSVTSTNITINPANPSVFYRLHHP